MTSLALWLFEFHFLDIFVWKYKDLFIERGTYYKISWVAFIFKFEHIHIDISTQQVTIKTN